MEILVSAIHYLLLVGIFISPLLLSRIILRSRIKNKLTLFLIIGIVLSAILTFTFAWWTDTSNLMLLEHYGYNIDGMNETEFYGKVLPANMEKVKSLQRSIMGIGWPLKAILFFLFCIPYLLVIYGVMLSIKLKTNKTR